MLLSCFYYITFFVVWAGVFRDSPILKIAKGLLFMLLVSKSLAKRNFLWYSISVNCMNCICKCS